MKKVVLILSFILLISCTERKIIPIEQYRGKGIILLEEPDPDNRCYDYLWCKNKDSTFYIKVPEFDTVNLKRGDTL